MNKFAPTSSKKLAEKYLLNNAVLYVLYFIRYFVINLLYPLTQKYINKNKAGKTINFKIRTEQQHYSLFIIKKFDISYSRCKRYH